MVLDLSETPEEVQRELLPPGTYDAQVTDVQAVTSRKGNPMLTWIFAITKPDGNTATLYWHTVLNDERGLSRIKKAVNRLLQGDEEFDWTQFKPIDLADWALGRQCRVVVRVQNSPEFGKGNQVSDVLPAAEGFLQ